MATTLEANHYTLTGIGIRGSVDTSSITGRPLASVEVDGVEVPSPVVDVTERGIEVAGVVSAVPDDRTVSVLLFLPRLNLEHCESATWSGVALLTTSLQSIGGPQLVRGATHDYAVRPLAGTAEAVQF
jgi:hypothetical protein